MNKQLLRNGMRYRRDRVAEHKPYYVLVDFHGMLLINIRDELWMAVH